MKTQKLFAIVLTALLIAGLFTGCGGASVGTADKEFAQNGAYDDAADMAPGEPGLSGSTTGAEAITPQNQKLIRTLYLDAETEDMDALLSEINARIAELEGYVESKEVYNGSSYSSRRYRNASLTIRIPAPKLDDFVNQVSQVSNITSQRETTEDVTLTYVAIQSRITALETEQTRLLELLAQAETMEDLLMIESRLTDVRAELEEITSQMRVYDNLIDYGTIYLDLSEVVEYTEPEPESGWQRMAKGFVNSLKGLGNGLKEFFIFLVISIPYLVLIAVIITVIVLLSRRARKKRRQKKQIPPVE